MTETDEMLSHWTQTDPVTGLSNRAYWLQHQTQWDQQNLRRIAVAIVAG